MRSHLMLSALCILTVGSLLLPSCNDDNAVLNDSDQIVNRDAHNFTYSINPAMTGDSVVITFDTETDASCGQVLIQVSGPDGEGWPYGGKPITPDSGIATLLFVPYAPGEYRVRGRYIRTGNPKSCDYESTGWLESGNLLLVEGDTTGMEDDSSSCEGSFTGDAVSCDSTREVVFTYVAGQNLNHLKIQGGLTNGTLEDPVVTVEGADLDVTIKTPGNSSNRVITLDGSAVACDTITITITWLSGNQGDVITGEWSATGGYEVAGLECE